MAIGILYATGWLFLAAHRTGEKPVYSTVHGLTSAFILTPMLWEMTVRFRLISATGASIVAVGFAVLGLVIGWRRNVTAVAWVTCASALLIACALFRETHDANLWTATLLAIAAAVEISACRDHWLGLRWLAALAADLAVFALTEYFLRGAETSEVLTAIHPGTVLGAQIALLTIYLASTVNRTIFRGLNATWFEIGQAAVALPIAIGGALRVAGSAPFGTLSVGLFCLLSGVACYVVSFAFLDRKHGRDRNFYTYSTFGMLLLPIGCVVLLGGLALIAAWSALAVTLMLAGLRGRCDTLRIHGAVCLLLAVWQSQLLQQAAEQVIRTGTGAAATLPATYFAAWTAACACYLIMLKVGKQRDWLDAAETWITAAIVLWSAAGWVAASIFQYISPAAPFRTGLLASLSMGTAWAGVRLHRPELMRLGYPLLALAGLKVILEDFHQGRSLPLFVSLVFCGGGLVLLPRLLRKTPSYFAQANKSSTR